METRVHLITPTNPTLEYITVWFKEDERVVIESRHFRSAQDNKPVTFNDSMSVAEFEARLMVPIK